MFDEKADGEAMMWLLLYEKEGEAQELFRLCKEEHAAISKGTHLANTP